MNVLFIVDGSLSNPVLSSQGIPHLNENSKKGVNFYVLSFEDMDFLHQSPEARKRYRDAKNELRNYARIYSINSKLGVKFRAIRLLIRGIWMGTKIVKKNKIDIIHGRSNLPSLIALFIKKYLKIKVLYDNRGLLSDEIEKRNRLRIKIEIGIEKYLLKKSDAIVVVSNAFKKYLCNKYYSYNLSNKVTVIENSFSERRFIYSEQLRVQKRNEHNLEGKFIMVYSGPSVYWQRFDLILKTFKILKELRNDAYFLVISYDPKIYEMVLNAGIDNKDFSVYNLPASEVNQYLISGDFGVIYRDDRIRSKVCAPIKLGEYLASGLPILSMNGIGDTDIILNKYKTGVIIENEKDIKDKLLEIMDLVKDPDIRVKCRKTAEENLSLKICSSKYLKIYTEI